eukprot:TRINITY_DN13823_c0_g1_i3.p1 TRINITY_DN13823_c0_g1~~TRINITY_DN13823_c0_g1_i3.p1  ORF type:complete len:370 (-),score=56.73 TRINITY_DN13823_c0_g1_i3:527-1636(-)
MLIQLRRQPGFGVVVVAASDIEAGTTFWKERPLVTARHDQQDRLPQLLRASADLDPVRKHRCLQLFRPKDPAHLGSAASDHAAEIAKELGLPRRILELEQICLVWQLNAHRVDANNSALYEIGSILSHSCAPNSVARSCPMGLEYTTTERVPKGRQLTVSYLSLHGLMGVKQRRALLWRNYLFECSCVRCVTETPVEQPCHELLEAKVGRLLDKSDWIGFELDVSRLVGLERECISLFGSEHWSSRIVGFIACEALLAALRTRQNLVLLQVLAVRCDGLCDWLDRTCPEGSNYFMGDLLDQAVLIAEGTESKSVFERLRSDMVAGLPIQAKEDRSPGDWDAQKLVLRAQVDRMQEEEEGFLSQNLRDQG